MDQKTSTSTQPDGGPAGGDREPEAPRPPLERSTSHRVVTGVCGGLGRRLDIDPLVFRVVIAVLCLWGGVGLFIYGVAWLMIPLEDTGKNELQRMMSGRVDGQSLGAVLVTVLGTGIFFSYMGARGHIFPLLLIAALAFAALRYDPKRHQLPPHDTEPPVAPEAPPAAPSWWQRPDPLLKTGAPAAPRLDEPVDAPPGPPLDGTLTTPLDELSEAPFDAPPSWAAPAFATPTASAPTEPAEPRKPAGRRPVRGPWGLLTVALAAGAAGIAYAAGQSSHRVNALAVLGTALVVMALGLALSGLLRRRAIGLAVLAILLSFATVAVAAAPWQHWSRTTWAPASATQLETSYSLKTGSATLDLTEVLPDAGQNVSTHVSLGAGELRVILPNQGANGPEIRVSAQAGAGELRLPDGTTTSGVGKSRSFDINPGGGAAHGTIQLDLQVGAGQIEVIS